MSRNNQLPAGWEWKKLGEVSKILNGGTPKTNVSDYWDGDVHWITPADLGKLNNPIVSDTPRKITRLGLEKSSAKLFPQNSIILSTRAPIGHLAINEVPMSTNQGCRGIVPCEKLNTWYLYYFLKNNVEFLDSLGTGTTFKELSTKALSEVELPLPPLPEQQRIVAFLDEAFAAIARAKAHAEQNLQNAKALFESYLQGVFAPLTSPGAGERDGWEERELGKLASFRNGLNFTKSSKGEKIKIVGVKDFHNNFWIPLSDLESVFVDGVLTEIDELQEYDIITVRSNGNPALIGRTLLAGKIDGKISHSGFTIRIRLNNFNTVLPLYLYQFLKTQKIRVELIERGNGVGIKSLNQGSLSSLLIPFPESLETQQTIVRQLDALRAETQRLEAVYRQKLEDLEELKKSVLAKAFRGELL